MADDDNKHAAELPLAESTSGDIEQGRSSSSWVAAAAAISGHTLTVDPSTALGGLEHVDVEEAAPVPMIQQIAAMDMVEMNKGETKAKIIKTNAAPSADASTTTQPPKQGEIEQMENGDDAAPLPLGYAGFDEDYPPKPKLDFGEESTDEDEGPPLPFTFGFGQQRDSLHDAKRMALVTSRKSSSAASPIDGRDPTVRDEENILQRVAGPENSPASDNVTARHVVSSSAATEAPERNPSMPILEGYLVEDEGLYTAVVDISPPDVPAVTPGGHRDTVYEATPLEPELPWWKQRRTKVFMVINCLLIAVAALSVGLGMAFSRPTAVGNTATTNTTTVPNAETGDSSSSTKPSYRCFADRNELKAAVDRYVKDSCSAAATLCNALSDTYGWPMGSWCVIDVTDMSSLFQGLHTFNEDISMWNVSHVTDMMSMFAGAGTFNRDISSWNISSVTNMSYMFQNATSFNQNLCAWQDNFPYSNADDIFVDSGCAYKGTPSSAMKGPFCTSSCNIPTASTDCFATRDELKVAVDQYVQGYWGTADSTKYGWPIGSWCVGKVTDMSELFKDLTTFNEDISGWEVGQVTTMQAMFSGASAFNGNISSWDTSAVTDMSFMFSGASSFNQGDLSNWDTSSVTTMHAMYSGASAFNGNISSWDTSAVTDMMSIFSGAGTFNRDISSWNISSVTNMRYMFWGASSFNQNLCAWQDNFPYSNAADIFVDSGCTFRASPQILRQGPFCAFDCIECILCNVVFGRQFEKLITLQRDFIFTIKACSERGDTSSNWCVYQTRADRDFRTFYLGSFDRFVYETETDTSVTAIFLHGESEPCPESKERSANVTFIMNGCKDYSCDAYDIAVIEDIVCFYDITVTLTSQGQTDGIVL